MIFATMDLARGEIELTDSLGRKATVEVIFATPDEIRFEANGRKGAIKFRDLSETSREAVLEYAKEKGVLSRFPKLDVQIKVVNQRRNHDSVWYKKTSRLSSSVVITGVNQMTTIPAAEAAIVILTQDTKEKYVKNKEVLKVALVDRIQIPAAGTGQRRELSFESIDLTFDSARDSTNVGGQEYKYYIFGLIDPETRQFLHFETNDPRIQKRVEADPALRENLLAQKKGAPFSQNP